MFNMFAWKYKIVPVNAEKNIYSMTPTVGTWLKAFVPALVPLGLIGLMAFAAMQQDDDLSITDIIEEESNKDV